MSYHLVARPIPIKGESPASVLIRAVEGNGYPSLYALIWAYWKYRGGRGWANASLTNPTRYRQIMESFGIPLLDEQLACFRRVGPTSRSARLLDGEAFTEKLFREDVRFYCPLCLHERAFWRKSWTLRPFSVCPKHHVYLLRDCQICGAQLHSGRGKLTICECGANLAEMSSETADPATIKWWLAYHGQSQNNAHIADSLYLAILEVDGGASDTRSEYQRLSAVRSWLDASMVDAWLSELINKQSNTDHPRIQLIPLLRSDLLEIQAMAKSLLHHWVPSNPSEIKDDEGFLTLADAIVSLGIGKSQIPSFMKYNLLAFPDGRKRQRGKVSRLAVNQMLFALQEKSNDAQAKEGRPPTCSLAETIYDLLSGKRDGAGYNIADGLNTLQFKPQNIPKYHNYIDSGLNSDWLDINQIAKLLGTYPLAVNSLCKNGWIPFRNRDLQGRKRLIASKKFVSDFNLKYVLAGTFASQINESPTNLAEKLMALGLVAVSGPKIDGTLLYLFKRDDIDKVDLIVLRNLKSYLTKTGRRAKPTAKVVIDQNEQVALSTVEAAKILNISFQEVLYLIRKGKLQNVEVLDRAIHVTQQSVLDFQEMANRADFIQIEEAAIRLKLSRRSMESLWIISGVLKVHDFGLWRKVSVYDLEKLEQILVDHVTSAEAVRILSAHRSHLNNLYLRGVVKSTTIGSKRKIRLFARSDVERLRSVESPPRKRNRRSAHS